MQNSTTVWYTGKNNYKKNTFTYDKFKKHKYNLEFIDQDIPNERTLDQIFLDHVSHRQTKHIEVLYSGGLDSECVLNSFINNNLPVRAITMRLVTKGCPINTHDLYYSEKFCRNKNIEQILIDLNIDDFFDNGKFYDYLSPYHITIPHVATHFWLFQQCTGFPVMGGDYSWPQIFPSESGRQNTISPHRHAFNMYDKFLSDNGIDGIGNMISYSMESNLFFLRNHVKLIKQDTNNNYGGDGVKLSLLKRDLLRQIGFTDVEMRLKSCGWDFVNPNHNELRVHELLSKLGQIGSSVTYGKQIANVIEGNPSTNSNFSKRI